MSRSGHYITQPTGYKSFTPTHLPPSLNLDDSLQKLLSEANSAIGRLDTMGYLIPNVDFILAMYIRKEALLSSQIEGTQVSLEDIFEFESDAPIQNPEDVEEVVNYIRALNTGMRKLKDFPMCIRLIKEIHSILLENTRGAEKTPGEFKKSQNWIGPAGSTLKNASFIPPPPQEATEAMGKLELFMHNNTLPDLIACALIHYQFETIHPFLNGNGRLGRLLITFYLCWKGILQKPLLYLSFYFKMHKQEYYDRLNLVRSNGDYEQWLSFFLKGVIWTTESALDTIKKILEIGDKHKKLLVEHKISSPYAIAFLDHFFNRPHVSIQELSDHFHLSAPSTGNLVIDILPSLKKGDSYCFSLGCRLIASVGSCPQFALESFTVFSDPCFFGLTL